MDVVIDLAILIVLLVLGVPVPFCFMAAVLFMFILGGYDPMFIMATGFHKVNSMAVLCILFFILMGGLMSSGGIASRLVAISDAILGRTKSGLGTVSIVSCAVFGAIAVLGQLIPPSVPMILYAWVTWQSVAACFLATVVPGIIMVGLYSFVNWLMVRKLPIKTLPSVGLKRQTKEFGHAINKGFFALLMPVIVLGGIYGGIFTPTEAAGIAVLYCIPVGFFIYHTLNLRQLGEAMVKTITTTGVIILMVFFIMILGRLYIMENVPQRLISTLMGFTEHKYVILIMVNVFLIILGMLMDDFSGTLLAAPLLFPLMKEIGIHPIHFAAILGTNLGLGNKTPPTAPILYLAGSMANCKFDELIKPAVIFMTSCSVPVVILTTYFPPLSLALPHLIMPKLVPYVPLTIGG